MKLEDFLCYMTILLILVLILKKLIPRKEIIDSFKNTEGAKKLLDDVRKTAKTLVDILIKKYPNDEGIIQLHNNFDPSRLYEGMPGDPDFTYTENKGEKVVLCLRDTTSENNLHTKNTVLFPLIHELSHIADLNYDPSHGSNFRKYFRLLLDTAIQSGLYEHVDFSRTPVTYCGVDITGNP